MNKKTLFAIILPLLLVILAVIVFVTKGTRLEWEKVADSSGAGEEFWSEPSASAYAGHEPRLIIITEPDTMPTLQGKVSSSHFEQIAETDFSSFFVAVIHRGTETLIEWPQGIETTRECQPIEVGNVRRRGRTITVYAELHRQVFDERWVFNPAISPYYILRIERPAGMEGKEFVFVLHADSQVIPQTCAMKGKHLPWEKMVLDSGADQTWAYKGHSPQLVIIADQDAVLSIQDHLPPQHLALVSKVDFSTHFVAIVFRGEGGVTNTHVEMIDVKQQDGTIVICARLHKPHPRQLLALIVGSPYYIMKVEKPADWNDNLTFVLLDSDTEVARQESLIPPLFESPLPGPTSAPTATPSPAPTPTATSPKSSLGFPCHSYLDLLISAGGAEEQAVVTSYRCHSTWIDSTGRFPPKFPSLVVSKGVPLVFRLAAEQQPATVEVRAYSEAGVSASFFIWPEELPIKVEPVDRFQPVPSSAFEYLPQVAPGEYSLVIRAVWQEPIEVFYALSFRLE